MGNLLARAARIAPPWSIVWWWDGSGGNRVLVVRGGLPDHQVEEEGNDHDADRDVDARRPAAGRVVQDPAHDGAGHRTDLRDQVEHPEGRAALVRGDHVAGH